MSVWQHDSHTILCIFAAESKKRQISFWKKKKRGAIAVYMKKKICHPKLQTNMQPVWHLSFRALAGLTWKQDEKIIDF